MKEQCELYDRECINCGECEICDIDPTKKCDDCGLCIDEVDEYRSVTIDDFIKQNVSKEEIERISKKLSEKGNNNAETKILENSIIINNNIKKQHYKLKTIL